MRLIALSRRPLLTLVVALCGWALLPATLAHAGSPYPTKPIRLIVPFPPGSSSDIVGRALGQKLHEQMGEPVVDENRPGAGGSVGIGVAAKSPPDGYTILIATPGIALAPALYSNLPYDAFRDLTPIARLSSIPNVMLVHPSVLEKINMVHVAYKGATQAMTGMMGGEVDEVIMPVTAALPQIRAGKVRPLAVLSEQRVASLPEVPTSREAGVNNFNLSVWYGMFAPAATPRDIMERLSREVIKALESSDYRQRLTSLGVDPWPGTPAEMTELLRSETKRYAEIVRAAGIPRDKN